MQLLVHRPDKDWLCLLGNVELYRGHSANEAQDLANALAPEISAGTVAKYERRERPGKTPAWGVYMGDVEVKSFGARANKAADLAAKINAALGYHGHVMGSKPNTPVDDLADAKDGHQVDLVQESEKGAIESTLSDPASPAMPG